MFQFPKGKVRQDRLIGIIHVFAGHMVARSCLLGFAWARTWASLALKVGLRFLEAPGQRGVGLAGNRRPTFRAAAGQRRSFKGGGWNEKAASTCRDDVKITDRLFRRLLSALW